MARGRFGLVIAAFQAFILSPVTDVYHVSVEGIQAGEGKTYVTRTDEDPGREIEIRVQVNPVDFY